MRHNPRSYIHSAESTLTYETAHNALGKTGVVKICKKLSAILRHSLRSMTACAHHTKPKPANK